MFFRCVLFLCLIDAIDSNRYGTGVSNGSAMLASLSSILTLLVSWFNIIDSHISWMLLPFSFFSSFFIIFIIIIIIIIIIVLFKLTPHLPGEWTRCQKKIYDLCNRDSGFSMFLAQFTFLFSILLQHALIFTNLIQILLS